MAVSPEGFRDEEFWLPLDLLSREAEVVVASRRRGVATGSRGTRVAVRASFRDCLGVDWSGVMVCGGEGAPRHLWSDEALGALVKRVSRTGVVAAICYGVVVLARNGLLAGRVSTGYPTARTFVELRRGGANVVDHGVIVDGRVVTARGPCESEIWGEAVLELLKRRSAVGDSFESD